MNVCWITRKVSNLDNTISFYEEQLDLKCDKRFFISENKELAFINAGSIQLEFIYNSSKEVKNNISDTSIGFKVENLDDWLERYNIQGIDIYDGPIEAGDGVRFFYILDPDGLKIQIFEDKR